MATEQDVDLVIVESPSARSGDEVLRSVLGSSPCDVCVLAGDGMLAAGFVFVPFAGAEHDWSALELGAWLASALAAPLRLAGPTASGKESSRLLASASLAVQRSVGVSAEPLLIEPSPERLLAASAAARAVVVGLPARWRTEGLGVARQALASRPVPPALVVRCGARPGGLAPPAEMTRFTWTVAPTTG